jgi:hypothetical protein
MTMPCVRVWLGGLVALCATATACACGAGTPKPGGPHAGAAPDTTARGTMVGADTLANTRIGGPYGTVLAFRFRSRWTGVVRAVRFYAVLNSGGRKGYSGGTGGTLRVSLARDSGGSRHRPARGFLASARVSRPTRDAWPLVRFRRPAGVVAGRFYHIVFTNVDRHPTRNYISVNALLAYRSRERAPRVPDGMAVLLGSTEDGGRTPSHWTSRAQNPGERYAPILDVVGASDDQRLGLGYMEVWSGNPKPIGGADKVRQLLGRAPTEVITGAWLRVRRRHGATGALRLRIERVAGEVLGSGTVPPKAVADDRPQWVYVRFSRPAAVSAGDSIALTATARESRSYEAFPIRDGTEFGFDPRTVFAGGYAQFTDAGSWVGWDQWGGRDLHNGDLQFVLDIATG